MNEGQVLQSYIAESAETSSVQARRGKVTQARRRGRSSCLSLRFCQVFAQAYNLNSFISFKFQDSVIARHDGVDFAFECAFEDAVVRLVGQHANLSFRLNELSDIGEEHGYASQFFLILPELPR